MNINKKAFLVGKDLKSTKHLDDAIRLLEAASVEQEAGHAQWQVSIRRAAELLEWLAHPLTNPHGYPFQLLSAAAYQIAGYPARASGLLSYIPIDNHESQVLRSLLKGEFTKLSEELVDYWTKTRLSQDSNVTRDELDLSYQIQQIVLKDTTSALGILCMKLRWGEDTRLKKALENFVSVGRLLSYGDDPYAWLLSKLTFEVVSLYATHALRDTVKPLLQHMDKNGQIAMERYLRQCYSENKNIAWPSQLKGIERLVEGNSFALCTPTGSGKTSVAELAIIQSLFATYNPATSVANDIVTQLSASLRAKPLVIYLVPSRALAVEVEVKLARVLSKLDTSIIVTGLYGGTDWGPTDAWLTATDKTVLICTYEKGEALIRFLGRSFLHRVSLVIVDEAHSVQYDNANNQLRTGENRSLRLEMLGSRLFRHLDHNQGRVIALSAVATGIEQTLTNWVTGKTGVKPAQTSYRSVRQLIGRLICEKGQCIIRYDLLDGAKINYKSNKKSDAPYVPKPFDLLPEKQYDSSLMKRLSPYTFWAAINFAKREDDGKQHTVLISITQDIGQYAKDFLNLLDSYWAGIQPDFFQEPNTFHENFELWDQCLRSCEDYFKRDSYIYQLLKKGIVVHQGSMPGAIGRLFVELIQRRLIYIVLATSTLSEGVNLPFETILIPSLKRWSQSGKHWDARLHRYINGGGDEPISNQEFSNLVGRSGRPGYGTEGRSLVVSAPTNKTYTDLIDQISAETKTDDNAARSPLAELLLDLENQWYDITPRSNNNDFLAWLEQAAPLEIQHNQIAQKMDTALETLDTIDGLLLSNIVEAEAEGTDQQDINLNNLEDHLRDIWKCTYAHYALKEEDRLSEIFVRRGRAIPTHIYPNPRWRRNLYCTGLPPRHGSQLITLYPDIKQYLQAGYDYSTKKPHERIDFIRGLITLLLKVPGYQVEQKGKNWNVILNWWLDWNANITKKPSDIMEWHKYVRNNFIYRVNWGIGSIVALASDNISGNMQTDFTLDNWPLIGLPWITLWLKELLTWGTAEPVAAHLLANKMVVTREEAEKAAKGYYNQIQVHTLDPNEILNAKSIRDWAQAHFNEQSKLERKEPPAKMPVQLQRDFGRTKRTKWRVLPVEVDHHLYWYDPAGFPLASSSSPPLWHKDFINDYDFVLDFSNSIITSGSYIEREITLD